MNNKGKLRKLIKRREAIIQRIEKDEKKFEEVRLLMERAKQKNQEKLNNVTQEILGCIDNDAVQAFVNQFTEDFVNDKQEISSAQINGEQSPENEEKIETPEESTLFESREEEKSIDSEKVNNDDDYAEKFRQQYGL